MDALEEVKRSVIDCDEVGLRTAIQSALDCGVQPETIVAEGIQKGLEAIGEKFQELQIFLSDMVRAAAVARSGIDTLMPSLESVGSQIRQGTVVIGTVFGDIHDIGKNLVSVFLEISGFEVHDIGVDAPSRRFVEEATEKKADVIAMSCLLQPSLAYQKEVIELLSARGLLDTHRCIIGGAATTPSWAERAGVDGWGKTPKDAVDLCKALPAHPRGNEPLVFGA